MRKYALRAAALTALLAGLPAWGRADDSQDAPPPQEASVVSWGSAGAAAARPRGTWGALNRLVGMNASETAAGALKAEQASGVHDAQWAGAQARQGAAGASKPQLLRRQVSQGGPLAGDSAVDERIAGQTKAPVAAQAAKDVTPWGPLLKKIGKLMSAAGAMVALAGFLVWLGKKLVRTAWGAGAGAGMIAAGVGLSASAAGLAGTAAALGAEVIFKHKQKWQGALVTASAGVLCFSAIRAAQGDRKAYVDAKKEISGRIAQRGGQIADAVKPDFVAPAAGRAGSQSSFFQRALADFVKPDHLVNFGLSVAQNPRNPFAYAQAGLGFLPLPPLAGSLASAGLSIAQDPKNPLSYLGLGMTATDAGLAEHDKLLARQKAAQAAVPDVPVAPLDAKTAAQLGTPVGKDQLASPAPPVPDIPVAPLDEKTLSQLGTPISKAQLDAEVKQLAVEQQIRAQAADFAKQNGITDPAKVEGIVQDALQSRAAYDAAHPGSPDPTASVDAQVASARIDLKSPQVRGMYSDIQAQARQLGLEESRVKSIPYQLVLNTPAQQADYLQQMRRQQDLDQGLADAIRLAQQTGSMDAQGNAVIRPPGAAAAAPPRQTQSQIAPNTLQDAVYRGLTGRAPAPYAPGPSIQDDIAKSADATATCSGLSGCGAAWAGLFYNEGRQVADKITTGMLAPAAGFATGLSVEAAVKDPSLANLGQLAAGMPGVNMVYGAVGGLVDGAEGLYGLGQAAYAVAKTGSANPDQVQNSILGVTGGVMAAAPLAFHGVVDPAAVSGALAEGKTQPEPLAAALDAGAASSPSFGEPAAGGAWDAPPQPKEGMLTSIQRADGSVVDGASILSVDPQAGTARVFYTDPEGRLFAKNVALSDLRDLRQPAPLDAPYNPLNAPPGSLERDFQLMSARRDYLDRAAQAEQDGVYAQHDGLVGRLGTADRVIGEPVPVVVTPDQRGGSCALHAAYDNLHPDLAAEGISYEDFKAVADHLLDRDVGNYDNLKQGKEVGMTYDDTSRLVNAFGYRTTPLIPLNELGDASAARALSEPLEDGRQVQLNLQMMTTALKPDGTPRLDASGNPVWAVGGHAVTVQTVMVENGVPKIVVNDSNFAVPQVYTIAELRKYFAEVYTIEPRLAPEGLAQRAQYIKEHYLPDAIARKGGS